MAKRYKIYLDVCCLNRPFDDWLQDRVRIEGEAVMSILKNVQERNWQLVSSEAIEAELKRLPDPDKLASISALLLLANDSVAIDNVVDQRSKVLEQLGFGLYDAFHIACAESAQVDSLLTTDDRLIRRVSRYRQQIHVLIDNPVSWYMKVLQTEGNPDENAN